MGKRSDNFFNTNVDQAIAIISGATFLRPSAITLPRSARVGVRFDWQVVEQE